MALKSKPLNQVRPDVPTSAAALGELARVNLDVPKATRQEWKLAAVQRNVTMSALIIEAMSVYLNK